MDEPNDEFYLNFIVVEPKPCDLAKNQRALRGVLGHYKTHKILLGNAKRALGHEQTIQLKRSTRIPQATAQNNNIGTPHMKHQKLGKPK
jgi:hypothetical protein